MHTNLTFFWFYISLISILNLTDNLYMPKGKFTAFQTNAYMKFEIASRFLSLRIDSFTGASIFYHVYSWMH